VARRYARALFSLGRENGMLAVYAETLRAIAELFEHPDLDILDALTNPLYPLHVRQQVMEDIAQTAGADALLNAFLHLLVEKKRTAVLPELAHQMQEMLDLENNICHAQVTSALELDSSLLAKIQAKLEELTGNTVLLETRVDPSIIGGIVAKVGDLVLDGSIRTQLHGLKESIKGRN
jgi:F-type H+-transporting ATPase subunit delta